MKTYRRFLTAAMLLSIAIPRAYAAPVTAEQACAELKAAAQDATLVCAAVEGTLTLPAGVWTKLKAAYFPEGVFRGYKVQPAATDGANGIISGAKIVVSGEAAPINRENTVAAVVNFDNAGAHSDGVLAPAIMTMGGLIKGAKLRKVQSGPPGSQGGPPGSGQEPQRGGPPGSGGPQTGTPPSTPPSRPAPVWRQRFAPPPPNWWNTDFNTYEWWQALPNDYDRTFTRRISDDRFYLYSGWARWSDVFTNGWVRETDTARINWKASDKNVRPQQRTLTSQVYRDLKECYYQDVYRYDWVDGGFYGSHWEENFDHYDARCIRLPREYGRPRVATVYAAFDLSTVDGILPWETGVEDGVTIYYDGSKITYDLAQRLFQYKVGLDDRQANSESWTITAGAKISQAPEADKVSAYLRSNGGKLELVINDERANFYDGESLQVTAVVKKDVTYTGKILFIKTTKHNYSTLFNGPIDVKVAKAKSPQQVVDLSAAASGGSNPPTTTGVRAYIESWGFKRVGSKLSSGAYINRGGGNSVSLPN
ncbi:MAG: hypothetical protein HY077_04990 [Elusimicrobia bacterium]|nr:hypothetical protein [Elusimicrobiota bacterium]